MSGATKKAVGEALEAAFVDVDKEAKPNKSGKRTPKQSQERKATPQNSEEKELKKDIKALLISLSYPNRQFFELIT